jgi:hypothetical protein
MPKNLVNAVLNSKPGREFCQLRPTFPDKPLLKHHVALCESCRTIAPLQLLFSEIFKLDDTFSSFAISKGLKRNRTGDGRHRRRAQRVMSASGPRQPRGFLSLFRCTDTSKSSLWTGERAMMTSVHFLPVRRAHIVNRARPGPRAACERVRACALRTPSATWPPPG